MAGIDINSFIGEVKNVARQYLFFVYINGGLASGLPGNYQYLVNATSLPSQVIDPLDLNWQGQIIKYASTHTWEDWNVTFKVDAEANIHRGFSDWSTGIHDQDTNVHTAPTDYFSTVRIELLDGSGKGIREMKLIDAWPQTVGEISVDYASKEAATFDVTFAYQYALNVK